MGLAPNPKDALADRISELEMRHFPAVLVYNPLESASGKWEAVAERWTIIEADPAVFCAELQRRLTN